MTGLRMTFASHVVGASLLLLASCTAPSQDDTTIASGADQELKAVPNQTAWAAGTRWSYETSFLGFSHAWVYRPEGFSKAAPGKRGVVFHLPGCGELPYQVAQGSGWPAAADEHGLVIVIPETMAPSHPNPSSPNIACYDFGSAFWPVSRWSKDHATIIRAGEDIVEAQPDLAIDPRQIYLTGLSAGATVAMQVACMAPHVFAGVAPVAGVTFGSNQQTAVLPPAIFSPQAAAICSGYAMTSGRFDWAARLHEQTYLIVSDDNGLPAGVPIIDQHGNWSASKFADQRYWDGDKYVPLAHHTVTAHAMASLFGTVESEEDVALPLTGKGKGCPGGEASHDDTAETKCLFSEGVERSWQARADNYKDSDGLIRVQHLRQDTLTHRWPAGPKGPLDHLVTPSLADLVAGGYVAADGQFDQSKVEKAPNGQLALAFFAYDSFSLPQYFAEFFEANNVRLKKAQ